MGPGSMDGSANGGQAQGTEYTLQGMSAFLGLGDFYGLYFRNANSLVFVKVLCDFSRANGTDTSGIGMRGTLNVRKCGRGSDDSRATRGQANACTSRWESTSNYSRLR
jgi:hypothetical protein